jgi:hypothetical protein
VVVTLDHSLHGIQFAGRQARGDDPRTAGLVIEFAPGLSTTPVVVTRCREARESKRCVERQDLPGASDRPKEDPLGFCFRESLVVEPDLQHPKHVDQEADFGSEQRGSTPEPFDLDD